MSLVDQQSLFLLDVARVIGYAHFLGLVVTGGELWRPPEMQEIYVQQGKSSTLNGMHLKRLAIDLNFFIRKDRKRILTYEMELLEPVGIFWEKLDTKNRWGGRWQKPNDPGHFERYIK